MRDYGNTCNQIALDILNDIIIDTKNNRVMWNLSLDGRHLNYSGVVKGTKTRLELVLSPYNLAKLTIRTIGSGCNIVIVSEYGENVTNSVADKINNLLDHIDHINQ